MPSFFPPPCPQLPEFQSLLVRGLYHASAPIHLLLSHAAEDPEARAVLLTPDRDSFRNALIDLNDQWIDRHSGSGKTYAAAQRTQIYYTPTIAHLRLLLSMLHEYEDSVHYAKTTLEVAPTLLVLHELSAYFESQASQATVSAYLSVVSSALALAALWSPNCSTTSRLVIFDSGLSALKLPILRSVSFEESGDSESGERDALSVLLERYIEWKVEFPEEASNSDDEMQTDETADRGAGVPAERKTLQLSRINAMSFDVEDGQEYTLPSEVVWTWSERVVVDEPEDGRERTIFVWD